MTPERLARAISALREMSTYSAEDLLCCLAEDPSTFQYVGDLLASHDALEARVRELEAAMDRAATSAAAWCGYHFQHLNEPGRAGYAFSCLRGIAKDLRAALKERK